MNMKKLFLLNLPYLLFVYPFDKLAQAFRLAPGANLSGKLLSRDGLKKHFPHRGSVSIPRICCRHSRECSGYYSLSTEKAKAARNIIRDPSMRSANWV